MGFKNVLARCRPSDFGLFAAMSWRTWTNVHNVNVPAGLSWQDISLFSTIPLVLLVALVFMRSRPSTTDLGFPRCVSRALDWACAVAMGAATVLVTWPWQDGGEALGLAGMALGGASTAWMVTRWLARLSAAETVVSMTCLFGAAALQSCTSLALEALSIGVSRCIVAVLPFVSCLLLGRCGRRREPTREARYYGFGSLAGLWKAFAVVASVTLIMVVLGLLTGPSFRDQADLGSYAIQTIVTVTICLSLGAWAAREHTSLTFALLWRVVMLLIAIALLWFSLGAESSLLDMATLVAWDMLYPIVFVTACDAARHSALNRYAVVSAGLCACSLPSFIGARLAAAIPGLFTTSAVCTVLLFILFVVLSLCLEPRDRDISHLFEGLRDDPPRPDEFSRIDERCAALGRAHMLTAREVEVMRLMCKGRSRSYIAEALSVTENTVKTHAGHVYQKLGVHSRSELQALIDS